MSLSNELLKLLSSLKQFMDSMTHKSHPGNTTNSCGDLDIPKHVAYIHLISTIPALIAVVILSFRSRRRNLFTDWNSGYPGPAIPMNILEMRRPTIPFIIAFISMSNMIFTMFKKRFVLAQSDWDPWLTTFINFAIVLVYAFVQYPIFASISQANILSHSIGLLYTLSYLAASLYILIIGACLQANAYAYLLMMYMPSVLSFAILVLFFLYKLFQQIPYLKHHSVFLEKEFDEASSIAEEYRVYVNNLLIRNKKTTKDIMPQSLYRRMYFKFTGVVYTRVAGFYYPPRLICSLAVALVLIYNLAVEITLALMPLLDFLIELCLLALDGMEAEEPLSISQIFWNINLDATEDIASILWLIVFYIRTVRSCFLVALILALFTNVLHMPLILNSFRNSMFTLSKKGFGHFRRVDRLDSPWVVVQGFIRYSGYQIGFLAWSFLIQLFVYLLLALLLAFIVYIPCIYEKNPLLVNFMGKIAPSLTFTMVLYVIQLLLTRFVFTKDFGSIIAINNRHAFFIYAYFAFFYNVLIGLFTGLLRIFLGLVAGIICLGRLDFSSLPNPCESLDNGYVAYLGFLYAEQYHQNPVLRHFILLVMRNSRQSQFMLEEVTPDSDVRICTNMEVESADSTFNSKRARIRWHLSYTLLNNRGLQYFRKHAISERNKRFGGEVGSLN